MWYGNIRSLSFIDLSQYTRLMDGQTDRQSCDSNTVRCITCSRTVKVRKQSARRARLRAGYEDIMGLTTVQRYCAACDEDTFVLNRPAPLRRFYVILAPVIYNLID